MAKIVKIGDFSWRVSWSFHPNGTAAFAKETSFEISKCRSSFQLKYSIRQNWTILMLQMKPGGVHPTAIKASENYIEKINRMREIKPGCWESKWICIDSQSFKNIALTLQFPGKGRPLIERMANLLTSGAMADVNFVINDQKIKAHKAIVASASSVMAAMFDANGKEGAIQTVRIADVEPDIFRKLLEYIYTDSVPNIHQEAMAERLFVAADKFQIDGLREICETKLAAQLNIDNVVHTLVIAHLHSPTKLLESSLQFLVNNQTEVRKRPEWKQLLVNYKDLFFLASERICSSQICSQCNKAADNTLGNAEFDETEDESSDDSESAMDDA